MWPWYKCQNSQNAQKCLRRVLKVVWGLPAESTKRVSHRPNPVSHRGNCLKRGFAPCKRLFWESHSGGPKTPFAPSLSTFGLFGCFDNCTRAAESQFWRLFLNLYPKDPSVLKKTTAIAKKVKLLRRSVFQIHYAADPSWRGKMSVTPRKLVSAQGTPR